MVQCCLIVQWFFTVQRCKLTSLKMKSDYIKAMIPYWRMPLPASQYSKRENLTNEQKSWSNQCRMYNNLHMNEWSWLFIAHIFTQLRDTCIWTILIELAAYFTCSPMRMFVWKCEVNIHFLRNWVCTDVWLDNKLL